MLVTQMHALGVVDLDAEALVPARLLPQLVRGVKPSRLAEDRHVVLRVEELGDPETATLASHLALADAHIDASAANRVLEGRNRELMAVNRVARSILSALEADNLLVVLLDSTAEYLAASYATCVLFDPSDTGTLRTHVLGFGRDPVLGLDKEAASQFFSLLRNSDGPVPASEKYNVALLRALQKVDRRVRRALFQPIKSDHGRPAGWIGIYAAGEEPPLTTQEMLFLSSISRLAALGLDKIALLDKVQQIRAAQEEAVRERTAQLEMAYAKIRALNRGLEARVTERTRALEEANKKLKEARAAAVHGARLRGMGQLAASFAHEINNPVAGLSANLDYMCENLDELRARIATTSPDAVSGLSALEEFEEVIVESRQSVERITAIIASLKRFGGEEEQDHRFALNAVVADSITLLEERLQANSELDLHLHDLPQIAGDSLELRHVVLALLTNSVEAIERSGARGTITITTFATGDKITMTVKDTGDGIEEALLQRVFEPFVSTKDGEPGAGLGLHSAYKAVRSAGGTMRIRSKRGEGTTVTVVLPTERDPAKVAP
jgi:signal transduction histidine kinase